MSQPLDYTLPEHLVARRAAQRREWSVQLAASLCAVLCLIGAALFVGPVNRMRQERQLVIDPDSIKGLPPGIALLGKLGTFRALVIDWAAIRAERLKDEGKTYEALQLHETVCALAPRYPQVWVYAAWNMAYNISVSQYTPEARWRWVQNGISILRDKGIQYNPRAVSLYKELAWIYWHKIGDFLDDEHLNYKRALAVEMELVLGAPPITLTDEEYFDWFRKLVDAPRDFDALLTSDQDVARLVSQLDAVGLRPDDSLLDFAARHLRPELSISDLVKSKTDLEELLARRLMVVDDPKNLLALDRLLAALRSKVLRERYHLDLDWALSLMVDRYGPLDWRNAFSHALYWATWGNAISKDYANTNPADSMNTARFILFSLSSLIMRGKITLRPDFDDPFSSYIELGPDIRYIPYLFQEYFRISKEQFGDDPDFVEGVVAKNYKAGLVTAMHNWIELLYLEGGEQNQTMAERFYAWLRLNNKNPNGSTQTMYLVTIDEFVMGDVLSQLSTYKAAHAFVRSFIQRALKQFSLGLVKSGMGSLGRARKSYNFWMLDTSGDINERRKMQPFRIILRDEVDKYLRRPEVAPIYKVRLWKALPLSQRQLAYDTLHPYFQRLCEAQDPIWDVSLAFAEPVDMEGFRRQEIEYRGKTKRDELETGTRYKG